MGTFINCFIACLYPKHNNCFTRKKIRESIDCLLFMGWKYARTCPTIAKKDRRRFISLGKETQKTYLPFPEIYQEAKEEINNAYLPELTTPLPDIDAYDLILIGSPVWWYSVAPAMLTFLSQYDFKEKPVALFSTHEGELRGFNQTFEKNVKNAKILPSENFHFKLLKNEEVLEKRISFWIQSLENEIEY